MTKPQKFHILAPGILGLATNQSKLRWSYGIEAPSASRHEFDKCVVQLRLTVLPTSRLQALIDEDFPNPYGKYHHFSGAPNFDGLVYKRKLGPATTLLMYMRGLLTDSPEILVNHQYMRYVNFRFMNVHSPGYILTDLANLLMLKNGIAPLHCSAFAQGDAATVIFAPPNTGKTLTAVTACVDHGMSFMAEDLAVTDGKLVTSVPWTSTFRFYSDVDKRIGSRMMHKFTTLFPPAELFLGPKPTHITDHIPEEQITEKAQVNSIVVLERGKPSASQPDRTELVQKVINLNRFEFNYHRAPALIAYEYFNPELQLGSALATEHRILTEMISTVRHAHLVRSEDARGYANLIRDKIGSSTESP